MKIRFGFYDVDDKFAEFTGHPQYQDEGKKIEITVIDIMRFKDGKLIEHWGVPDRLAAMEQLGMKPPPKFIMKLMALFR